MLSLLGSVAQSVRPALWLLFSEPSAPGPAGTSPPLFLAAAHWEIKCDFSALGAGGETSVVWPLLSFSHTEKCPLLWFPTRAPLAPVHAGVK